jgi:hypothetical protein
MRQGTVKEIHMAKNTTTKPRHDTASLIAALKAGEVARRLGVQEQTLAVWRWKGTGPKWFRLGRKGSAIRYREADLRAFIEAQRGGRVPDSTFAPLSADKAGLLGAATARAEAQAVRLAMLYGALDGSATITTAHLEAALAVWQYAEASARYLFGDSTGDSTADAILKAVRSSGAGLTGNEISTLFNRHKSAEGLKKALRRLFSLGLVEPQAVAGKGRPSTRWAPAGMIEKEA